MKFGRMLTNGPTLIVSLAALAWLAVLPATAEPAREPSAARGYDVLRNRAFLPADFDDAVFEKLWTVWPAPLRDKAAAATPQQRRAMTFARYGLHEPPEAPPGYAGPALGYVDDGSGGWVMNCFSCHGGRVAGEVVPGAPNADLDLQTLVEEARLVKLFQFKPPGHLDLAALKMPLGGTRGTTNSVVFGIVLDGLRKPDMSVDLDRSPGPLLHHDMDAPPWWNVRKKSQLYADGFSPKNHRVLMQFMLLPKNDRATVLGWEDDFRDVLTYINSLEPPRYAGNVDAALANQGQAVFETNCATCHGTYDSEGTYPEKIIPLAEIGTDPLRLASLSVAHRAHMQTTWMTNYGADRVLTDPGGYVAPPLDGIWATAPYFHNGGVPTLWHVLHPAERPVIWRRSPTGDGHDAERMGLAVETLPTVPQLSDVSAQREIFDTRRPGKSAAGHDFPDTLTEPEKRAVLEYLKTL